MFKNLFSNKKLSSKEFHELFRKYRQEFFESYMTPGKDWIKVLSMILPSYGVDPGLFNPINMVLTDYVRLRTGFHIENCVFLISLEKDPDLRGKKLLESIMKSREEIIELRRDIQWGVRIEETPRVSTLMSFMSFKDKTFRKNNGIWIVDKVFDLVFGEERVDPNDLIRSREESEFILDYLLSDQYCFRVIQKIYCDFDNYGHILLGELSDDYLRLKGLKHDWREGMPEIMTSLVEDKSERGKRLLEDLNNYIPKFKSMWKC